MLNKFKSVIELLDYYKEESTCIIDLEIYRWEGGRACPHCGNTGKIYTIEGGKRYKCGNKECYKKFSVTVGTVFENTKIPLRCWFAAIYIVTSHKKGISSLQLARDLGITQKTAWFMLHRIREMLKEKSPELLEGTVEVDETYIGGLEKNKHKQKKSGKEGRGTDKIPVLAIVERGGRVKCLPLSDVKSGSITIPVFQSVKWGSTVITDQFNAYYMLRSKFDHQKVNHSKNEFVRGNIHTNSVEGYFSILKRGIIGIYHSISPKHLARYCDEFSFRYNTRKNNSYDRFTDSLKRVNGRLTWNALVCPKPLEL